VFATMRRIRTTPGRAREVARLIESEYVPLVEQVDGYVSYTLVDLGDDEVASVGVFTSAAAADEANAKAQAWTGERLKPLVASPLEARAGEVVVEHRA
jgi:heme-degrading monooxygenase HmoA